MNTSSFQIATAKLLNSPMPMPFSSVHRFEHCMASQMLQACGRAVERDQVGAYGGLLQASFTRGPKRLGGLQHPA